MPELPEVETSRRTIDKVLRGKRLVQVQPDPDDRIVYDVDSPAVFRRAIEGARVIGTGRKGKYFWLKLDRRPWPVFHLGMSGNVEVRKKGGEFTKAWGGPLRWRGLRPDPGLKVLPYCRLRLLADDGTEVAITDPRRFGRIRLANDPLKEEPIASLGYDPLEDFPSAKKLGEILGRRRAPIKAVLLDQGLFAGVGNWMADEILFQARLSPHRLASQLKPGEVAALRRKLHSIVKRAVDDRADYEKYPRSWLFHNRWGKEEGAQTSARLAITHDTVGGRTTAWVPSRQK